MLEKNSDAVKNVEGLTVTDEEILDKILRSFYIVSTVVLFFVPYFSVYIIHGPSTQRIRCNISHYPFGCALEILNIAWGDISSINYEANSNFIYELFFTCIEVRVLFNIYFFTSSLLLYFDKGD